MASLGTTVRAAVGSMDPARISFSGEFPDEDSFISINPKSVPEAQEMVQMEQFEFLSGNLSCQKMLTADELFSEGKLLPFWAMDQSTDKLSKIKLKEKCDKVEETESKVSWFVDIDGDPSPRPPKCTVLWKELLRLKKQRASSSLSPPSSSSSSSSSSLGVGDLPTIEEGKEKKEKQQFKMMRIRPMVNVPICRQGKNSAVPPLPSSSLRKGRLER